MSAPSIYVACLAAYNAGHLHGAWIDAAQSAEEINTEMQEMLSRSPIPGAEEWAIHDFEGFGSLRLCEYESIERVSAIARGIAEHGLAFAAWLSYDSCLDATDTERFIESYLGEWDSMRAYAEDYAESVGLYDAAEKADSPYITVDVDMLERDLNIDLYTVATESYTVYVFDPNV